jgi:hypothetical protein
MMAKRPPIPAGLEREVLVEAGHRCAIPACRQVPVEVAHIVGWARCKKHEFHNLIPLCPTCHTRFDKGEIDLKSMVIYKHKLATLNRRYGSLELRILNHFAQNAEQKEIQMLGDMAVMLQNLVDDKLLADTGKDQLLAGGDLVRKTYALTPLGYEYIARQLASSTH